MKGFLLDTCVLQELMRSSPEPSVLRWISQVREDDLFLSVLSIGELTRGVEKMAKDEKRREQISWLENELVPRFKGRILEVDAAAARTWGVVGAIVDSLGMNARAIDLLVAAQALTRGLALVSRFERNFSGSGAAVLNPWVTRESRT
jgi:predicted nucleic acid-binding protein